jgi:eukaryotic translation initiation factor 2C
MRLMFSDYFDLLIQLVVGNSEDCIPNRGRWNYNNKRLFEPVKIERWAIVNFSARCDMSRISRDLINCGRTKGIVSFCVPFFILQ